MPTCLSDYASLSVAREAQWPNPTYGSSVSIPTGFNTRGNYSAALSFPDGAPEICGTAMIGGTAAMTRLKNKRVVITGTGSGIGRAAATRFAAEGAAVACLDINESGAEVTAAAIATQGGRATAVHCDVADEDSVVRAVAASVEFLGGIDICWANAGGGAEGKAADLAKEVWD